MAALVWLSSVRIVSSGPLSEVNASEDWAWSLEFLIASLLGSCAAAETAGALIDVELVGLTRWLGTCLGVEDS